MQYFHAIYPEPVILTDIVIYRHSITVQFIFLRYLCVPTHPHPSAMPVMCFT